MLTNNIGRLFALITILSLLTMGCEGQNPGMNNNLNTNGNENNSNQNTNANQNNNNQNQQEGLLIEVDETTSATMVIPDNANNILYTVFALTAVMDTDIAVEEFIVTRDDLGDPQDFERVMLYIDGVQHGSPKTFNTSTNQATFSLVADPIIIPARQTVLMEVRGNMETEANHVNKICFDSSYDVYAFSNNDRVENILGEFPACGNPMTTFDATQ